jgi:putative methionine-R-sulfoxide reductase with GAF domain
MILIERDRKRSQKANNPFPGLVSLAKMVIQLSNTRERTSSNNNKSNTSNAASLIWHALHALPKPSNKTNWAGFYVLDPSRAAAGKKPQLILGPFQGKVACQVISFGRGVCGAAAASGETQLVGDVDSFPGHIACDGDSKSEIVVPVVVDGKVSLLSASRVIAY